MDENEKKRIYDAFAASILNTRFEDIDQATVDNTKLRIYDIIGDAIGGATLPDVVALVEMVEGWGGKQEATIIGHGIKAPVPDVAFVNCTMCRGFDRGPLAYFFKDRVVPHHVSETTVLTALTLGESRGISGKELIAALVVGDDISARLHLANDHALPGEMRPEKQQVQPAGFQMMGIASPTYGAAAIAGRLLGLTRQQMINTFGMVGNSEGFGGGIWDGAPTFKISQGTMARSGVMAAMLAKAGWTGATDPLFGDRQFGRRLDHPDILYGDLGKKFYVENGFKRYPGGGPTQSPNHAAITIVNKYKIKAEDIEEAILRTSPGVATGLHYARPYKVGDYPTGDALFSYKYGVASALLRGTAGCKDYDEKAVRDPRMQALIPKVKLALAELDKTEGVELVVKMKDGRTYTEYCAQAQGEPAHPLPKETLVNKFMEQVEYAGLVSKKNAEAILAMTDKLEEVKDVRELVKLAAK